MLFLMEQNYTFQSGSIFIHKSGDKGNWPYQVSSGQFSLQKTQALICSHKSLEIPALMSLQILSLYLVSALAFGLT